MKQNKKNSKRRIGAQWENVAADFLLQHSYEILERNFYYNHGEVDIVAKDGDELVFVEVKFRRTPKFGTPEEALTPKKQELLRRTAEGFVVERNMENISCRFDVVAIQLENGEKKISHYKNAF